MKYLKKSLFLFMICALFIMSGYVVNNVTVMAYENSEEVTTTSTPPVETSKPEETENPIPAETATPEPVETQLPPIVDYAHTDKKLSLKYDDRHIFSKEIRRINTETVTSNNVKTGKKDKAVIRVDSSNRKKIFVIGCGKAVVELVDGTTYGIKAQSAKISLILLVGQSNMEGIHSVDKSDSDYIDNYILNTAGKVYSTYGPSSKAHYEDVANWPRSSSALSKNNAKKFVPYTLTDNSSGNEWCRTNNLTAASSAYGKSGIDSALADQWVKKLKEKVWVVNASHGGSSITTWTPQKNKNNNFAQAVALYKECEKTLNREIAAGHYKLSHKGYFWLQGEQDYEMAPEKYLTSFMKMHRGFKTQLKGGKSEKYKHVYKKIEFAGILMVRSHKKPTSLADVELTGPRKAQYYMCNSNKEAYKDIFLASQLSEVWITNNSVKTYFKNKYKTDAKFNQLNTTRKKNLKLPTSMKQIHSTIHYSQVAYNELGRDAVNNICYALGYVSRPSTKAKIKIVSKDGYKDINLINKTVTKNMNIVVKVFPAWKSKKLTIQNKSKIIAYDKWKVNFKENKAFNAKLLFSVGKTQKKFTVYSKNSTAVIKELQATEDGVKISWKANSYTSYCNVYRREKGSKTWTYIAKLPKKMAQSYNDIFAEPGKTYEYAVTAYDSKGNGGQKVVGEVTTLLF